MTDRDGAVAARATSEDRTFDRIIKEFDQGVLSSSSLSGSKVLLGARGALKRN